MPQPALFIFAKQPIAGRVKTRLQPDFTPAQAAEIAAVLICETVTLAVRNWPGSVYLCGAPDSEHPLFATLADQFSVKLLDQGDGDLGARMQRALANGIAIHGAAAVIGSDVPHCPWTILDDANDLMARGHNVLGPAADGGYYFIGLTRPGRELFTDMAWGAGSVLAETLRRATAASIDFKLLPSLRDIDTAADLWLVARQFAPLHRFLD
ncbi:MAG: TIGR04282 family arsenosugar biosynthesis glycosyltransferase [Gammaproteobacteria bacterium]|nr:TIGR04282 family arsenosugar biosynthesis glycosyltransferase [Gammaproteobacteria bacterium]